MNKFIKTTGIFILGIGLMTGCTDKVAQKIDTHKNNITSEFTTTNKKDTTLTPLQKETNNLQRDNKAEELTKNGNINIQQTQNNNTKQNNVILQKHNLTKAGQIIEPMAYGMLNLRGSSTANVVRYIASTDRSNNIIKQINLTKVLDLLNTYNAQTFNKHDVLQRLRNDKEIEFVQLNNKITDYNKLELEKLVNHKNKVIFFEKDQVFIAKSDIGYGGPTDTIFMPVEKWEIHGDRVLIPFETIATRKPIGIMTLHLNNKNYDSGIDKTMYYVEKFEIY
ncbi:hypothetical protein [uncultured Gemella sp.]|uniref:hypothetical protein n=1 Tax=uncultured Gemella sp. TaxID=254352 RepID=UPI0028D39CF4|nr:hypothetical protein [uncultured Gemella sp.]